MTAGRPAPPPASRWAPLAAALVTVLLRLPWLGRLGLQGDEDISTLAARGIAGTGLPGLPSGHLYWRSPLFHYLAAPLAGWEVDWAPRLLSVLAAGGTAFLIVRIGRRWVGEGAALAGALLFAVSLVEIGLARQIRMYALYQLAALLAFAALYRFWTEGGMRWGWLSAGAVAVAASVHALGATLAALFLLSFVRVRGAGPRALALLALPAFALLSRAQYRWTASSFRGGHPPAPEPQPAAEEAVRVFGAEPFAFGSGLLGPALFAGLALGLGLLAALLVLRATRGQETVSRLAAAAGGGAALALAGAHQLGLAFAVLLLLSLQLPELLPGARARRALIGLAGGGAALGLIWLLAALAGGEGPAAAVMGLFGRSLGRFVRHLVLWPPAITLPALIGAVLITSRAWRGRAADGERFLLLVVVGLVAGRSLLAGKWEARYLADLWIPWELVAGGALAATIPALAGRLAPAGRRTAGALVSLALAIAVLLSPGTSLSGTLSYLGRGPGPAPGGTARAAGFATDIRGAVTWLEERLEPGDRVVATDWLTTYCYLGRLDGWLRATGWGEQSYLQAGKPLDSYLSVRVLPDLDALREWARRRPLWIVVGGREWGNEEKFSPGIQAWLAEREAAYVAADGRTRVYRVESRDW